MGRGGAERRGGRGVERGGEGVALRGVAGRGGEGRGLDGWRAWGCVAGAWRGVAGQGEGNTLLLKR